MNFLWKKRKKSPVTSVQQEATSVQNVLSADNNLHHTSDKLSFKIQSVSETGPSRQQNEDSLLHLFPGHDTQTVFAMVADGMGGHNAGEVASSMACEVANAYIKRQYTLANTPAMLEILMQQMHQQIRNASQQNNQYQGMGTTAVCVFIKDTEAHFASVGDSRIYYYSNNTLQQLTTDQTLVNQMISEGKITVEEGQHHEMKHVLLQALGTVVQIKPELSNTAIEVKAGDKFFLCSDGIYDMLSDEDLLQLLSMPSAALTMECVKALCTQRRARDNFSAVLMEVIQFNENEQQLETKEQNVFV